MDLIVTPAAILRGNDRIGFIGASVQGVDFPPEMRTKLIILSTLPGSRQ